MQTRKTIAYLNKQYKNVLIKCFMAGIMAMSFMGAANAVDVSTYDELKTEIENNKATDINITNDIVFTSPLSIDTPNTIINGGGFTFNGTNALGSIYVDASATAGVEFNNIKFNNFRFENTSGPALGGAIVSIGTIKNIANSMFSGNYAESTNSGAFGGAILNHEIITNITNSTFTNNYAESPNSGAFGGAILNYEIITNITNSTFTNNYAESTNSGAYGGAISNYGNGTQIGTIAGDFTGNFAETTGTWVAQGGAIINANADAANSMVTIIDTIAANFTNNYVKTTGTAAAYGGAIFNWDRIKNITNSTFIGNYADATARSAYGGAIYNEGTIENIENSIFINNYAKTTSSDSFVSAQGGAIYNALYASITIKNSIFKDNYVSAITAQGGAISNSATTNIIADNGLTLFEGNYTTTDDGLTKTSNAIHNDGTVNLNAGYNTTSPQNGAGLIHIQDHITGGESVVSGIFSSPFGTININSPIAGMPSNGLVMFDNNIWGNHIALNAGSLSFANGTTSTIGTSLTGATNFTATAGSNLYIDIDLNNNKNDFFTFNFNGQINIAFRMLSDLTANSQRLIWFFADLPGFSPTYSDAYTNNALYRYNSGNIDKSTTYIDATTAFNTAINDTGIRTFSLTSGLDLTANGGTMGDAGTLTIFGNIINEDVMSFNTETLTWELNKDFNADGYYAIDGAGQYQIVNIDHANATLNIIDTVIKNAKNNSDGGAIINAGTLNIYNSYFAENVTGGYGGVIYNSDTNAVANIFNSAFIGNKAVVHNDSESGAIYNENGTINIYNSHFEDNITSSYGGAISNYDVMNIYNSTFIDNTATTSGGAIGNWGTLNIYAVNGNTEFSGNKAKGVSNAIYSSGIGKTLNLLANNGSIIFNDSITSASINPGTMNIGDATHNGTVVLNADMSGFVGDVTLANGVIKIGADMGQINNANNFFGGKFIVNGGVLDSSNNTVMDRFNTASWTTTNALDVKIDVDFASGDADYFDNATGKNINITGINVLNSANVSGLNIEVASAGNVLTLDASAKTITTDIYKYTVDDTNLNAQGTLSFNGGESSPASGFNSQTLGHGMARQAGLKQLSDISRIVFDPNRMELPQKPIQGGLISEPTGDVNQNPFTSAWFNFSGTSEDIKIDNVTVENESYVAIIGADVDGSEIEGFNSLYSFYAGLTFSSQDYDGSSLDQNGFVIGGMATFDKDELKTAFNVTLGANFVDTNYSDEFETFTLSLVNKTSYDYEIKDSNITIVPSMMIGYHFLNSSDYTVTSSNVLVNSDALNVLAFTPEIKVIADFEDFRPYASIAYNLNVNGGGDTTAGEALLPELTTDGYAELTLGMNAEIKENISGYGEIGATFGDVKGWGGRIGIKYDF